MCPAESSRLHSSLTSVTFRDSMPGFPIFLSCAGIKELCWEMRLLILRRAKGFLPHGHMRCNIDSSFYKCHRKKVAAEIFEPITLYSNWSKPPCILANYYYFQSKVNQKYSFIIIHSTILVYKTWYIYRHGIMVFLTENQDLVTLLKDLFPCAFFFFF